MRVDDEGNEIIVKEGENSDVKPIENDTKPTKKELIQMLDTMAKNIEDLPSYAKQTTISQYDFLALISLLSLILKTKR